MPNPDFGIPIQIRTLSKAGSRCFAARAEAYECQASGGPRIVRTEQETNGAFSLKGIKAIAEETTTGASGEEVAVATSGARAVVQTAQSSARCAASCSSSCAIPKVMATSSEIPAAKATWRPCLPELPNIAVSPSIAASRASTR